MDPATVDQAEAMIKALESMRANLDKFDEIDMKEITIDRHTYNINDTMQYWLKCIFTARDRNKKKERKEEKLKSEKMKRLLQFSIDFPTKLEDDASVLAFLCHLIHMQPLLPTEDDQEFLDEPALVSNVKSKMQEQHPNLRPYPKSYHIFNQCIWQTMVSCDSSSGQFTQ